MPEDKPSLALRKRKSTSMGEHYLFKRKKVEALVSAGNTGALMAMSKLELRMLDGILRPAIAATFPHKKGEFVMLDLGQILNVVKKPITICSYGFRICKSGFRKGRPKLAILNIGTEADKGKVLY